MKSAKRLVNARRRVTGFTLLEILISIVVIAFGMLGVAGLQAFALKNSQGASYRSVATVLATDLIDRMRANPVAATNGMYANGATQGTVATEPNVNCLSKGGCNTAALAAHDLKEWQIALAAALPGGVGYVCQDAINPNDGTGPGDPQCSGTGAYVVKIWWIDDRSASNKNAADKDKDKKKSLFATEFQI